MAADENAETTATDTDVDGRVNLIVLFGGQSAEHDVSCVTATHVLRAVDQTRYRVTPVGIDRKLAVFNGARVRGCQ